MKFRSIAAIILLFFAVTVSTNAADKKKLTKTITYELRPDGTLIIEGSGPINDFSASNNLFHSKLKKARIKELIISEGITYIGGSAFSGYRQYEKDVEPIKVTLPSTLEKIGMHAFSNSKIEVHFNHPIELESWAFEESGISGTLELPAGMIVGHNALGRCDFDTLIVNGGCVLEGNAFSAEGFRYGAYKEEDHPSIKTIIFKGNIPTKLTETTFKGQSKITTVYLADENAVYPKALKKAVPATAVISSPESRVKEQGVTAYVDYYTPSWKEFLAERTAGLDASTPEEARRLIEKKVEEWQKKGEFESTSQWQTRVNEKTRAAMVKKLSDEYNSALSAVVEKAKVDYTALRTKKMNEYFAEKIAARKADMKKQKLILKPYDADNQTFMISSPDLGDILLKVPQGEAAAFKRDWEMIAGSAEYEFVPVSETTVGLSKVTFFGDYPKKYVYDGKGNVNYTMTEIDYNFSPLEITDGDLAQISIADIKAPVAGTTVTGGSAIEKKTAQVEKRSVSAGDGKSGVGPQATPTRKSVIDTDIPAGVSGSRNKTFALLISNENYNRTSGVPYARQDGQVLSSYLTKTLGIPEKNIFRVEDATLNDFRYYLRRLGDVARAYDGEADILVYYAGHGVPDDSSRDAYLLPVDGYADDPHSGLSLSEFADELAALPSKRTVLLLDACFSGAGREGDMLTQTRGVAIKAKPAAAKGNLVIFSASQGTETAQPLHDEGHGMFTYYLLKKLHDSRGQVTLGELADYVISNVKRASAVEGKMQTPSLSLPVGNDSLKNEKF